MSTQTAKVFTAKSGAWTIMDRCAGASGMWYVKLYSAAGAVLDSIRCDSYRMACEYRQALNRIIKDQ